MRTSRMKLQHLILTAIVLWRLCGAGAAAQSLQPDYIDDFAGNPRVVVLSDIGNEPDDQMSFVRLLLYSNELDLEALIATTSTWQKNKLSMVSLRRGRLRTRGKYGSGHNCAREHG